MKEQQLRSSMAVRHLVLLDLRSQATAGPLGNDHSAFLRRFLSAHRGVAGVAVGGCSVVALRRLGPLCKGEYDWARRDAAPDHNEWTGG